MPVKPTTSSFATSHNKATSSSASSSSSQYSLDVLPIVLLCNKTKFPHDPRLLELIKLFEKQNIDEFLIFLSHHQEFLVSQFKTAPHNLVLMFRRLMLWRMLKFEKYFSLETLQQKLRCDTVDALLQAIQDAHTCDHYLSKTLQLQLTRFLTLNLTPKALMGEEIIDLIVDCYHYTCKKMPSGPKMCVDVAATAFAMTLTQDIQSSVKAIRVLIDIYHRNSVTRESVIATLAATTTILGDGHPCNIYLDTAIIALHTKNERDQALPFVDRAFEYMTLFPVIRQAKSFLKMPAIASNHPHRELVLDVVSGNYAELRTNPLIFANFDLYMKVSRVYKIINMVFEKDIHDLIDLCRWLEFSSTEEVVNFLHDIQDYVIVQSDEYGAHLTQHPSPKTTTSKK